jgi:hypothetical protein
MSRQPLENQSKKINIFGRGYMGMTGVEIPEKYLMIGADHEIQRSGEEGL